MNLKEAFNKADKWFQEYGKHTQDRKRKFFGIVGRKTTNRLDFYAEEVRKKSYSTLKSDTKKLRLHYKKCLDYQKSEEYKAYRRKYEAKYRDIHRLEVRYNSWRSINKPSPEKEIDYLLKRFLRE